MEMTNLLINNEKLLFLVDWFLLESIQSYFSFFLFSNFEYYSKKKDLRYYLSNRNIEFSVFQTISEFRLQLQE